MSNLNNIGFNNKAWGNMSSGMVPFQQQHQVFQNAMSIQQQNLGLGLQQMANNAMNAASLNSQINSNPIFQQVAYPNTRGLNSNAFQSNISSPVQNNSSSGTKQRVFTGKVTQIHDNFGLVDEEVIFQLNTCVKGSNPVVGDRVLVEASYTPNMHFKWSATRVQVLSLNNQSRHSTSSKNYGGSNNYSAVPPPSEGRSGRKSLGNRRERSRDRERDDDEIDRKRRREERLREREKEDKKSPVRRRSRSPKARRRSRIVPRYMVQVPKIALDLSEADVLEARRRYSNLYIPSDFFYTNIRWVDSFPPDKPFALNKPCSFHIMNKETESAMENNAVLEPSDADYLFSAKVMLMSVPAIEELYQKCCAIAEYKERRDRESEEKDFVHPTRLINFLVGLRGKNETMAIGGPWSPSLDGENPDKDPSVLIKTAIRTCKALTGIDLSSCTQWYRFVELYYRRSESTHKGKNIPARVETVVLFLPDVWSCLPTCLEWDGLQQLYRKQLERMLKVQQEVNDDASTADEKEEEQTSAKPEPTHYSQLDPKTMVVNDLRNELKARNISNKGLKSQLVARLSKALKLEAEKNEETDKEKEVESETESLQEEKKLETEERKLDDKEKAILEKRYNLPEHPHIIVHPSKVAKSGKFDCTVMSLSLLLDYRPEDTKEHSFEVSLFAELFNEMLIRDFGFNIFKALHDLPEKPKEEKKDEKKEEKKDKDKKERDDKKEKDKASKEDKKKPEDVDDKKEERKKEEKKQDSEMDINEVPEKKFEEIVEKSVDDDKRKETKKEEKHTEDTEDDDDEDDEKDKKKDKKKKKEKVKLYTKDKHLLLSFVYFDQTHCGYIFDKDIEDLLFTLGLKLSRAQVRKLVSKVIIRDSLHYRKLTDKPKDDLIVIDDLEKESNLKELALGNKKLLPIFTKGQGQSEVNLRQENETKQEGMEEGFVMFQGAVVDVRKLKLQLERSENARLETESRMVSLKNDNQKYLEKINKSSSTIKHLNAEVKDFKEKLRSSEDTLSRISAYSKLYETTLIDIRDKIDPVLRSTAHKDELNSIKMKKEPEDKDKKYEENKSRWEKDIKKEEPSDTEML